MADYKPVRLPSALLATLMQHAVQHLIPPAEIVALSVGGRTKEPFLFDPSALPPSGQEQTRLTLILSYLYQQAPAKFDEVVATIHGTKRTYFGRTAEEVESTGSSTRAMRIPHSPWFVNVNNPHDLKARIIERVMRKMGFSGDYASMIATLSYRSKALLPWPYRRFLD
jgi:SeqA protein C-terminal domain